MAAPVEPPQEPTPVPAPGSPDPTPTDVGHDEDAQTRSREAAGYRTRLREAEQTIAERDGVIAALRGRLDDVDRVQVEALAEQRGMIAPADLWTVAQLSDVRAEDGALDVEKVRERVDELLKERPHWKRPNVDLGSGPRTTSTKDPELGLSKLLGKR